MSNTDAPPKLFMSYSWSTPEHEDAVLALATSLVESGIHVILDKWDLKEGHDSISFMEQMVNDATIKKVAILADPLYVEKANGRLGGVGTETQIISPELYAKQDQNKFVLVVMQRSEDGKVVVPIYYKSRIHIDLSAAETYAREHERLVRWVFDKPLNVRPTVGARPAYLDESHVELGTGTAARRAVDFLVQGKPNASSAVADYLSTFAENLGRFCIVFDNKQPMDEEIVKSIDDFLPSRTEFLGVATAIARYGQDGEFGAALHQFFERALHYYFPVAQGGLIRTSDRDNLRFIVHELYLYTLALLLRERRFKTVLTLISTRFYVPYDKLPSADPMHSFSVLISDIQTLNSRNQRLELRRVSLRSDMIYQRAGASGFSFADLAQVDLLLFLRAELKGERWWPMTWLYTTNIYAPFELFARASSRSVLSSVLILLGIDSLTQLEKLFEEFKSGERHLPVSSFDAYNVRTLAGFEQLGKHA